MSDMFPAVDAKTMETAEKLAKFVAQVGPEIEQFSIDNSADNPDLWWVTYTFICTKKNIKSLRYLLASWNSVLPKYFKLGCCSFLLNEALLNSGLCALV